MLNPNKKIAIGDGIDLPVLYVYLAGRICGEHIELCLNWRTEIINHYTNWKLVETNDTKMCPVCFGSGINKNGTDECEKCGGGGSVWIKDWQSYPIAFISPIQEGEIASIDKQGLTSRIPPNLIYDKDLLSVRKADVIVANMDDFFEVDIEDLLEIKSEQTQDYNDILSNIHVDKYKSGLPVDFKEAFYKLQDKILNRRENMGTLMEVGWALLLDKPLILIVPERRRETFELHPFAKRASVIVASVKQLLEEKHLQTLYKAIAGA